ncbi:MAG TPA: hypothetical protein VLH38_01945 [Patescibacteria group bacterium]|nr:hypothetical protein [Patescibacteria group bacterium]
MTNSIILIANPGSASRRYAIYDGEHERAQLHFESIQGKVVCTIYGQGEHHLLHVDSQELVPAVSQLFTMLRANDVLHADEQVTCIGLQISAPSSYFLEDHLIDTNFIAHLEALKPRAHVHISAALEELRMLQEQFSGVPIMGISDSAFHITKPDYAWNYGISLEVADHFEIKRFGYHGLSAASVVHQLEVVEKLPPKIIICHLGSGASVSAVHGGKSVDNTMGYSPVEGVIMSTRSGSIDPTAVRALKDVCRFDDDTVEAYLNEHSGLLGLGGSTDIRELLRREEDGDNRSRLALSTYVFTVQKAIGQMAAALGGADALVFTGMVGERSAIIRERVVARLHYLDFILDEQNNTSCNGPEKLTTISRLAHSKPIFVAPVQESAEIARHVLAMS